MHVITYMWSCLYVRRKFNMMVNSGSLGVGPGFLS